MGACVFVRDIGEGSGPVCMCVWLGWLEMILIPWLCAAALGVR